MINSFFISYSSVLIKKLGTASKKYANREFNICMKIRVWMELQKEIYRNWSESFLDVTYAS